MKDGSQYKKLIQGTLAVQRGTFMNSSGKSKTAMFVNFILGSMHRNSILIRSNKLQQYAGIYLLQNHSTCFGCPSHPSSGENKTVSAASGTGHSI